MEIVVYSKEGCPFCSLLKMELDKRGLPYRHFDLTLDDIRQEFYRNSGTRTVPQVFLTDHDVSLTNPSGVCIGGWSDVKESWNLLESTRE